jgi:Carboxypeptidase regulatory-like domain
MSRAALTLVLVLLCAVSASAQTTGSITGTITDNSGGLLPGVRVTASSPALMGVQVAITNEQGVYRFPALPPGTYALKCELPGFATLTRQDIIINIGFTATVPLQLTVATMSEAVTVTGESPVVDTKNTNIQTNVTEQMLKDIPNSRDIWTVIGQMPGFRVTSLDVGGSRAGTQTGYSAFGYSGQVRVSVDGVNTTEGTGGAGFYYDYGSFQELQLGADGNDASSATPGVQLNAIVKSGGNRLKGDFYFDYENSAWQGHNVTDDLRRVGVGEGQRMTMYRDPNIAIGGPIKRDKFWYFVSVRDQQTGVTVPGFPVDAPSNFEFPTRLTNYTYKLNYQLSRNNRLGHYIQWGRKFQPYRGASSTSYLDTPQRQDSWSWAANFEWNSIASPRFVHTARYSTFGYDWPDGAYGINGEVNANLRRRMTDSGTGNTAGAFNQRQNDRARQQFDWSGTYFKDHFIRGDHGLKFGWLSEWEMQGFTDFGFVDNLSLTFNSAAGSPDFTTPQRVVIRNTPRKSIDASWHHGAYVNDQWSIAPHITLNIGVRWDYYSSYYPDQEILDGPFRDFFYAGAPLSNGFSVPATPYAGTMTIPGQSGFQRQASVAPRVGVAWNFNGNKTAVKLNWGRFYFNTGLAGANVNPAQSLTYTFNWNDANKDRAFTMDELGTFVSNAGGTTNTIDPNIKHAYTDSTSIWLEHELLRDISVRVGYTYKSDGNNSQNVELQRLGSLYTSQLSVADPGIDGTIGTADDGPNFIVWDIPTGVTVPTSRTETRTVDGILSIDRAVDFTISRRLRNNWSIMTNILYNWDRGRGRPQNPNQERFNDNTVTNMVFRVVGSYHAKWGIVVSPVLRFQGGEALARQISVSNGVDLATGVSRSVRVGTITYDAERSGSYQEDNVILFDTRLEKRFNVAGPGNATLGLFFDAFNINNTNKSESNDQVVGRRTVTVNGESVNYQRFLRPTGTMPPRVYRVGFRYSF